MLTTLTDNVRPDVALAWLEAPDVGSVGIEEDEELTFAETMAAIVEQRQNRVREDLPDDDGDITTFGARWLGA